MGPWGVGPWVPEIKDSSVMLVCKNHPDLCWNQKNLGYLGARNVFFFGWFKQDKLGRVRYYDFDKEKGYAYAHECNCPGEDLLIVYGHYRLDLEMTGPQLPREVRDGR